MYLLNLDKVLRRPKAMNFRQLLLKISSAIEYDN